MTDEEIAQRMRESSKDRFPIPAIEIMVSLSDGRISQFRAIKLLAMAFPETPLSTWALASASRLVVGDKGYGDDEVISAISRGV
jgi:hypothetical protein